VWNEIYKSSEVTCKILEVVETLINDEMDSEPPRVVDDEDIEKIRFKEEHMILY